jgi:serine/threonine protein kinase
MVFFMPNYACAIVATLPVHIFQKLSRRLRHAREMGSYHLEELLGRGGMGEVWRGRHRLLARGAAIKLVRPELIGASRRERCLRRCCAVSNVRRRQPRPSVRRTPFSCSTLA